MTIAGIHQLPPPVNEPARAYAPESIERDSLRHCLDLMAAEKIDLPLVIDGEDLFTEKVVAAVMPHDRAHVLGTIHQGGAGHMNQAIKAAERAWADWSHSSWEDRAGVFLKAAELLAGPWRDRLNAATMLGQSKTIQQAEIDAACELCDFFRFNALYQQRIYAEQPQSSAAAWNMMEYRPLEGFVLAVTPFNFTSIAGNLPAAPALMGNTVVWKPSTAAAYSAHHIMRLLQAAGLPDGVINLLHGDGAELVETATANPSLAGVHFTGSTAVFQSIWARVGGSITDYRNYPRLVGETGGKNFVLAHASAEPAALATAIVRGGFEYQGQKCSAASRIYVASSLWADVRRLLVDQVNTIQTGDVADFRTFMGAVIDSRAFQRHREAIAWAIAAPDHEVLVGGGCDDARGWFVQPTVILTSDPGSWLLQEELFGPIVAVYVYPDRDYETTLDLIDRTAAYALTGSIFATDRQAIQQARDQLRYTAGNFYINDKPTGAVVGQQPFGGARASGTNDKAGSLWNLMRWVSPRTIKETFAPPTDYRYPSMG